MKLDQTNKEILEQLCLGLTTKEISKKISVSIPMIVKRMWELRIQTHTKNNVELAIWWERYKNIPASTNK